MLDLTGVVSGGVTEVGNGVVNIQHTSTEGVLFLSGSGGLGLEDHAGDTADFTGSISGFGSTTTQFIDLTSVTSATTVTLSYTSANPSNTSGTLTVKSAGRVVAAIAMVGDYATADFHLGHDGAGHVEITDPPLVTHVSGGSTASGTTVSSGGTEIVDSGGTTVDTHIDSRGIEIVSAGGTAIATTVSNGGTLDLLSGVTLIVGGTLGAGAIVETASSGIAIVSGTVTDAGALYEAAPGASWKSQAVQAWLAAAASKSATGSPTSREAEAKRSAFYPAAAVACRSTTRRATLRPIRERFQGSALPVTAIMRNTLI